MPDLAFDLRHRPYAMLVAEHGSFRRAADVLELSQSTISRRVQSLERRLGVTLFDRRSVREDQPIPHQEDAALTELDVIVVMADDACARTLCKLRKAYPFNAQGDL